LPSAVGLHSTFTSEMVALVPRSWKAPTSPFQHCGAFWAGAGAAAAGAGAGAFSWLAQADRSAAVATNETARMERRGGTSDEVWTK
jgi:hypothetical protein